MNKILGKVRGILFFTLCVSVFFSARSSSADNGRYLIDFGISTNQTTSTGWNNWTELLQQATDTLPLIDTTGAGSSVNIRLTDTFAIRNVSHCLPSIFGVTGSTLYPSSATSDSFYLGNNGADCTDHNATVLITGLSTTTMYTIRVYGSRLANPPRMGIYTISGASSGNASSTFESGNNTNNSLSFQNIVPNAASGTVSLKIDREPTSSFAYLGVLEIIASSSVPVSNQAPTANAGTDISITSPTATTTLIGTGTDPENSALTYLWAKVSGTGGTIASSTASTTALSGLSVGTYVFSLTVTDSLGSTSTDTVSVTVRYPVTPQATSKKIVVLGSSTAAGWGPATYAESWVRLYTQYIRDFNISNTVVNLAVGGYTTYHIMPTGYTPPVGRPNPDTNSNITAALNQSPDGIIVNMPTNDTNYGYPLAETEANFRTVSDLADAAGVPIWITTSQPRNISSGQRAELITLKDWINSTYGTKSIDFWTTIANSDGTVASAYDAGDGIHLNAAGHAILFQRTVDAGVMERLYASTSTAPLALSSTAGDAQVSLSWSAPSSDGGSSILSYEIYANNVLAATTSSAALSKVFNGLTNGTQYTYYVVAINDVGPPAHLL